MQPQLTRRTLLKQSAIAGAAIAGTAMLPAARYCQASPLVQPIKFGLVTYLWGKDMALPELLENCEKAGLLGVELRTEHKHGVEPSLTKTERNEVRRRFEASPVQLIGYGSNCEYHSDNPQKVKENIELTKRYIELMHDCGGSGVKVKPNGFSKGLSREATIEQIGRSFNEVAEYGAKYGQRIRVEVHGAGTSELPAMRDIFAVATHPNVYVCWNSNDEDLQGEGLEANFKMVADRIGDTTHVRELNLGDYPYAKLMQLFQSIHYDGWILLEARTDPADKVAAMAEQNQVFQQLVSAKPK